MLKRKKKKKKTTKNNTLQSRRPGFDLWIRKVTCRRDWTPIPVFLPGEKSLDKGAWQAKVYGVAKESGMT